MLAILLLAIVPLQDTLRDRCDLVEVNHFYDNAGREVFSQLIFYDWEICRYQVIAWRMLKEPSQYPIRNWRTGGYDVIWNDGEKLRHVKAQAFRETWLQNDPELDEQLILAPDKRQELSKGT